MGSYNLYQRKRSLYAELRLLLAFISETPVKIARLVTLAVGVIAVVFAISIESVLGILIYSYNFWAPIILVPLVLAILGLQVSRIRFLSGAAAGIAAVIIWSYILKKPWAVDGLVIGVFVNWWFVFLAVGCKGAGAFSEARPKEPASMLEKSGLN